MGEPLPFFVSEFTLVVELFEHNFIEVSLIWEVGGKVSGPRPFLVYKFKLTLKLFIQNFVVVHAFI